MRPVCVLHKRQCKRGDTDDDCAEKRNHRQKHRRETEQEGVVYADDEKPDGVEHRIANRHQHLSAKEGDQILFDGIKNEDQFFLGRRFAHRQIIFPMTLDAALLQQKVKCVNGNQRQPRQHAETGGHFADLAQ